MHPIDPKLKKVIFNWIEKYSEFSKYKIEDNNLNNDEFLGSTFSLYTDLDYEGLNPLFNYYEKNKHKNWYVFKGEYPLIYIQDSKDLIQFISFFGSKHIPILVDYYSEKLGLDLPYKTLIWGNGSLLNDESIKNGIHGRI